MHELETRIIDIDVDNIRKILLENNAQKVKSEDQ
ncbi:class IV adenylate cyclase, partial [Clostridium butyricum]